jgi:molecular chaperone GrpE
MSDTIDHPVNKPGDEEKIENPEIAEHSGFVSGEGDLEPDKIYILEQEIASLKDQWMRAVAETENIRRRSQREREETTKYANTNFSRDILAIADNLRRALESCSDKESLPASALSLVQGIELTENALISTFERHNIKKIFPLQEKFDPNFHQAMIEIEDATLPAGTIVQVLQAGYMLYDRLLRPAMVGVSKQTAHPAPPSGDDHSL